MLKSNVCPDSTHISSELIAMATPEEEIAVIKQMVDAGAVDGFKVEQTYAVDGFPLDQNRKTLERLHEYLAEQGIT